MQTIFDLYKTLNSEIHVEWEVKHENSSLGFGKKNVYRNNILLTPHWLTVELHNVCHH